MQTMKTMHGGVTNSSGDRVRLSVDARFQPLSEPSDPRFPMHGYGPTPLFAAADFIEQQGATAGAIGGGKTNVYESWGAAKQAWGVERPLLPLLPDPRNPPPEGGSVPNNPHERVISRPKL